jgi:hypothetical protein
MHSVTHGMSQQQEQLQVVRVRGVLACTHRRVLPHHHGLYQHEQLWHPHVDVGADEVLPPALPGTARGQRPMLPLWSLHLAARDRHMEGLQPAASQTDGNRATIQMIRIVTTPSCAMQADGKCIDAASRLPLVQHGLVMVDLCRVVRLG